MHRILTTVIFLGLMATGHADSSSLPTQDLKLNPYQFNSSQWESNYTKITNQGESEVIKNALSLKAQLDTLYSQKGYLDPKIAAAIYAAYDNLFKAVENYLNGLEISRKGSVGDLNDIVTAIGKIGKKKVKPSTNFFPEKCLNYQGEIIVGRIDKTPTGKLGFNVYSRDGSVKTYFFIEDKKNPGPGVIGTGKEIYISRTPAHMVERAMLGKNSNENDVVVCLDAKPSIPSEEAEGPSEPGK